MDQASFIIEYQIYLYLNLFTQYRSDPEPLWIYDFRSVYGSLMAHLGELESLHKTFLRIWSHLLKKSLMENFIFHAVSGLAKWTSYRSSHRRCSVKKGVEIFKNSQETPVPESLFLIKLQVWGLQLYQKRLSVTGVFLWILKIFYTHLFYKTPPDDCFCSSSRWASPDSYSSNFYL